MILIYFELFSYVKINFNQLTRKISWCMLVPRHIFRTPFLPWDDLGPLMAERLLKGCRELEAPW